MNPNDLTPEQVKAKQDFEQSLLEEMKMVFTKGELLAIFNILTRLEFKYGDMMVVVPIIKKIEPIVAVDTNIPKQSNRELKNQILTGSKMKN